MSIPPSPWVRKAARETRPPRQQLSLEAVLDAAFRVLDNEGIDALSMRRVAQELKTGPSSLYAYVESKDDLLELMLDQVIGEVDVPDPDPGRWQEQLKQVARETRRALVAHPGIAQVLIARIPTGPNALDNAERMMAIGRAGGLSDQMLAYLVDLLGLYTSAVAYEDSLVIARYGPQAPAMFNEYLGQIRDYFAALPPERYPNMIALSGLMMQADSDDRFEFGLDIFVTGIAAHGTRDEG